MLRFCFGASGAGKSTLLYQEIIKRSIEEPGRDFYIIVPDQFTMQTQKDVVRMHPSHAIMNIDVLSFGRLCHRIFDETGLGSFSVLDDVGKSLVLRRVSDILGDRLPIIGSNMHKPGYIDEVKSTISEFMQYGIGDEELAALEEKSYEKGALNSKIKDLRLLYSEFLKYIDGKFITTEEKLDVLCKVLPKSGLIKDSIIVFDGFTGFTPIQYRVIENLLALCKEVVVSLTISPEEDPEGPVEDQELFMLTKKTVRDLEKLQYNLESDIYGKVGSLPDFEVWRSSFAKERSDIFIKETPVKRLEGNKSLAFLEENLFRYNKKSYEGDDLNIALYTSQTPLEEVRQTFIKISELINSGECAFRDIAIVCGSLDSYSDIVEKEAEKFDIPVYIDQNTKLVLNPFVEFITSAINIVITNYKYEDVFHYMRSGMTSFDREDVDYLENYVRALGISGKNQWEDRFSRRMPRHFKPRKNADNLAEYEIALMAKLENMRSVISANLAPLFDVKEGTVKEIATALMKVIEDNDSENKLLSYQKYFEDRGDLKRSREYGQIYGKIMGLLQQMMDLIGDDKIDITEFRDILNAGFGEIEVGTIPQDVDRIIVGDIERTRLKEIKNLFFIGVNDGAIPSNAGSGGILSDIDRQFLLDLDTGVELAPTPRQQMYIQRLYLYMNLTKPTNRLYLSCSELDQEGKSLRPAYLIPKLLMMFKDLKVERPEDGDFLSQNVRVLDSCDNLAVMLRKYTEGTLPEEDTTSFMTLYKVLQEEKGDELLDALTDAAFKHYTDKPIAKGVAEALYGVILENSVSRLERFASCCYAHFISYGLNLEERSDYDFDVSDLGNVFHEVLERYTSEIIKRKIDWRTLPQQQSDEMLNQILTSVVDGYGDTILRSSARNQFMVERIRRILSRTVETLKYQVSKGRFNPEYLEMDFSEAGNLDEINIDLSADEKDKITRSMKLRGRIDRIDLYKDDDNVYVKVIDFKSGKHRFNVASLYYGLQLQLVMYMDVAIATEKKLSGNKNVVPAAILYYHVDDPVVAGKGDLHPEEINEMIKQELRMTGLVNEDQAIIQMLDEGLTAKSDVIPVELKKDGTLSSRSQTASRSDYDKISAYVHKKIKEFGNRILDGDIAVNPYEMGTHGSCTYCQYRSICGYDEKIPGFNKRKLDISDQDAMEIIRNGG
ncbi:PD-(D/E)XK nuclease family protein [Butyrivibrio proteoclasticus]|uniref:PD-(D/E)XK nuclease family protein n=1 Tax=Butyrivibrio proteoclasticus TaxID=43305 RepID=UPI00055734A4|nr:PD-(D/E)XK nuclease family protein [Butyrivibrio proteoclasticus]